MRTICHVFKISYLCIISVGRNFSLNLRMTKYTHLFVIIKVSQCLSFHAKSTCCAGTNNASCCIWFEYNCNGSPGIQSLLCCFHIFLGAF